MRCKEIPIPGDHVAVAHRLSGLAIAALIGSLIGFVTQEFWLALGGWLLSITFKL